MVGRLRKSLIDTDWSGVVWSEKSGAGVPAPSALLAYILYGDFFSCLMEFKDVCDILHTGSNPIYASYFNQEPQLILNFQFILALFIMLSLSVIIIWRTIVVYPHSISYK